MELTVVEGTSNRALSGAVLQALGADAASCHIERFPDGELRVEALGNARGHDVYIVQSMHPPVGEHLLELLMIGDAYRRAGACRLTAVVPYFGYARQDRRSKGTESLGARLVADLLCAAHLDRIVAVDLHAPAVEGCFSIPVEHLTAVPLLAEAVKTQVPENGVIVSPDLGAVKLAEKYAQVLGLPIAIVHKHRVSGAEVTAAGVVGDVAGKRPILIDDMITTGGTVEAAAHAVIAAGALPELTVAASHGLLVGPAVERLTKLKVSRLLTSDSVPAPETPLPFPSLRPSLAPMLAETIRRLHEGRPITDLVSRR